MKVKFEDIFRTYGKHLRIIIPDIVREKMGLDEGDEVLIEVKEDCIIIKRANRKLNEFWGEEA
ncbi:MAG: AbrB/MazE/SpoVT family DNA-binding domain-containing protein [Archaeoglobus sp.]|nr:AbrB/MazE/SpoVT family DNA-binding domain-containing protein [Archaeoglobus sp.]